MLKTISEFPVGGEWKHFCQPPNKQNFALRQNDACLSPDLTFGLVTDLFHLISPVSEIKANLNKRSKFDLSVRHF